MREEIEIMEIGFEINDERRHHINLSEESMQIIEKDMIQFNHDYNVRNKSGFLNRIFTNYYKHQRYKKRPFCYKWPFL